jgi:L-glyceraldehyde 3-phosphate reductase
MTSLIIGASSVEQLETNIATLTNPALTTDELDAIDATVLDL